MRLVIFVLGMFCMMSTVTAGERTVDKAKLQAAMQMHIQRNLVNGAILHLDTKTGDVRPLYPTQAHPMVIAMGENFVLCTDLRDKAGKARPLDLYMAPSGRSFTVFHTEIDNRAPLTKLIKKGLAKPLR
jgi:hypothetical protein